MEKPNKNPLKLEDIGKQNIFSVPDNYFEMLPSVIQARAVKPQRQMVWFGWHRWSVAFASIALLLVGAWFFTQNQASTAEQELAKVSNQEIIEYLKESDITQSEVIESASNAGIRMDQSMLQQLDVPEDALLENLDTQDVEDLI
jgi:cytoskeletal protein RodZ